MPDAAAVYTSEAPRSRKVTILRPLHEPKASFEAMRVATFCSCGQPLAGFAATATRCPGCGEIWILGSPMRIG